MGILSLQESSQLLVRDHNWSKKVQWAHQVLEINANGKQARISKEADFPGSQITPNSICICKPGFGKTSVDAL